MLNNNKVSHFCCDLFYKNGLQTNCFDTHNDSYLKLNQLKWLFEKNNNYCNHWIDKEVIDLFETNFFISYSQLTAKQISILFTFVKKYINELRSGSMTRSDSNRNGYKFDNSLIREKISSFLAFLKRRLFEICFKSDYNPNDHLICCSIMKEMKALLLFIGRLSRLEPQIVRLAVSSEPETAIHNFFHSCLDIWWTSIELTFILSQNNRINLNDFVLVKEEIQHNLCFQAIKLVLYDLIALSVHRFNHINIVHEYLSLTPFLCSCIKEMFIMIKLIISAINTDFSSDHFFDIIFSTFNLFFNSSSKNSISINDFKTISSADYKVKNSSLHFVWFTTIIASVFNYEIDGQYNEQMNAGLIPSALLKLIARVLKENDTKINESELSCIILFFLKSTKYWKPNSDLLLPFTEFFLKKLNYRFFVPNSIEELGIIPKSSSKWHLMIRDISSLSDHSFRVESSFKLFLSLVSTQLSQIFKSCDTKTKSLNWQKFKGKVIVNLQPKKLEAINETGIFNLFSFFLILIDSSEELWSEMIDKIIDTITELAKHNSKNSELIFKFSFTLLFMKPISKSDTEIACFISKHFNKLCEERVRNSGQELLNKSFSNLLKLYFEELESIVKSNRLSKVSFDKLLKINFSAFSCSYISENEKLFVLNFINDLLIDINETIESQMCSNEIETYNLVVINTCFDIILPYIKQEISHKNFNKTLAEIAYNFTTLTNSMNESKNNLSLKFTNLFNDFLTLSRNNNEFTCHYLSISLENPKVIQSLQKESSNISSNLITIWCRLLVTREIPENSMDSLSRNLCSIIDDLRIDQTLRFSSTSLDIFILFLRNLTEKFSKCEINERMPIIQRAHKYLNDMIFTSELILKQNDVSNLTIARIYEFMSNLVLIASQLLYIPGKPDCLLPKIVDSIILNNNLQNLRNNQQLSRIYQKAFPAFFGGFCKLSYCGNPYLERQIRRMISLYLPLLVNRSNNVNIYSYIKTDFERLKIYNHWCELLLETMQKNFFTNTEITITPALIEYLRDFCKFDLSHQHLIVVLALALDKTLVIDLNLKENLFLLIKTIIEKITNSSDQQNHNRVLVDKVFGSFIEKNLSNRSLLKRFFEILNLVTNCCPQILHELIGEITRNIESIEKKRNIGKDSILRKALHDFANQRLK